MLAEALESVVRQTGLKYIKEVIVIENLLNRDSENICRQFHGLNINYVFLEKTISPGYNLTIEGLKYANEKHVAYLFDDDWWTEKHIERAVESFQTAKDVVATFGSSLFTTSPNGHWLRSEFSFNQYFSYSGNYKNSRMNFTLEDTVVACLLRTTFHLSTLVVKKDILLDSIGCFKDGNPYDTDRLIAVEFALKGQVIIDNKQSAFIRTHNNTERNRVYLSGEAQIWWDRTTERILNVAKEKNINLKCAYEKRMIDKKVSINEIILNSDCHGSVEYLIKKGILQEDRQMLRKNQPTNEISKLLKLGSKNHKKHINNKFCTICFLSKLFLKTKSLISEIMWWYKNWRSSGSSECNH
jgi:hypothetical protein